MESRASSLEGVPPWRRLDLETTQPVPTAIGARPPAPSESTMPRNPFAMGQGLVPVKTDALRTLLRHLYRGDIEAPLALPDLTRIGLQYCASDLLHHLRGLDNTAVRAVLVAVLAERKEASA